MEVEEEVLELEIIIPTEPRKSPYEGIAVSLEAFEAWDPEPDGWKYEWENGIIVTGEEYMLKNQWFIVDNIVRAFAQTSYYKNRHCLMPEADIVLELTGTKRRPDIAYFTREQIQSGKRGENPTPEFVIEVVSKNDNGNKLERKVQEYFEAGVRVVWYVYAEVELVRVFRSAKHSDMLTDDEVCSAEPLLPEFSMKVSEIFAQ
jgi:Uma2 family endonuclease